MAWNNNNSTPVDDTATIYDLRKVYAEKIVGVTLQEIKVARENEDYYRWFHLLKRDLRTEISQKLDKNEEEILNKKINEVRKILRVYGDAYVKKSSDANEHEYIEDALCELERLMYKMMENHKMYGSKEEDEGLF